MSHRLMGSMLAVLALSCRADESAVANVEGGDLNLKQLSGHTVYLADSKPELVEAVQSRLAPFHVVFASNEQAEVVVTTQYLAAFDDLGGLLSGDDVLSGGQ